MKKLFLILFLFFSFENISYSQDLNEILKRLDKIDKRLSDIEDKMKFFDILSGLETSGLDKTNENIDNSLFPKIKAEIGLINCKKAEYYGNDLYIAGTYQNNCKFKNSHHRVKVERNNAGSRICLWPTENDCAL